MEYEILFQPAYSLLVVKLNPGDDIRCEGGAMVSMSGALNLEGGMNTGADKGFFGRALGAVTRMAAGESFFISKVSADGEGGEVTLAPSAPGDIFRHELKNQRNLILQAGSFLACAPGVDLDTEYGGLKSVMGGEGLFFLRASGAGDLFFNSFGGIFSRYLDGGEKYVIDSSHMVAFEEGMDFETRMAGSGGFFSRAVTSAKTGEGLVLEFTGPGLVWVQSRNPDAFGEWVQARLQTTDE